MAARWRRGKYYLLIGLLVSSLFSVNLVGLFDPLSLLYRTLAIVFYPAFGYGVEKAGLTLYRLGPPVTYVSEPLYQFFKATVLPFRPLVYLLPLFTLVLFALVVAAERVDRRFWCRALLSPGGPLRSHGPLLLAAAAAGGPLPRLRRLHPGVQDGRLRPGETGPPSDNRMPALPPLPGGLR